MNETTTINTGGFSTLLLILFIGLKLTGVITWSWWWVLSPIWLPMVLGMLLVILILIVGIL